MKLTVEQAVAASFKDPSCWRKTLDSYGNSALDLIKDDQHFADEMHSAGIDNHGDGLLQLMSVLSLREIFYLHCQSEERHENPMLNHWDSYRKALAVRFVREKFAKFPSLNDQLKAFEEMSRRAHPMLVYQSQLLSSAAESVNWPPGIAPLVQSLQRLNDFTKEDEDFLVMIKSWNYLTQVAATANRFLT